MQKCHPRPKKFLQRHSNVCRYEAGNIYPILLFICWVFLSCCGSVAWPQATVWASAWGPRLRTCDRSYVQRLHLVEGTSPHVLPCLCAHEAGNATLLLSSSSECLHHRECYLASMNMRLVVFNLFLCSSAECPSPDAAVTRRRRQQSKHRPEHHDQVRATRSERCRGRRSWHHDQVTATHKETCVAPWASA